MIGDDIEITVVDIRGDKIRLGIAAPSRIAVHRKEVYESIRLENEQAANFLGIDLRPLGSAAEPGLSPGPGRFRIATTAVAGVPMPTAGLATTPLGKKGPIRGASPATVPRSPKQARAAPPPKYRKAV